MGGRSVVLVIAKMGAKRTGMARLGWTGWPVGVLVLGGRALRRVEVKEGVLRLGLCA